MILRKQLISHTHCILPLLLCLLFGYGCKKERTPANMQIVNLELEETFSSVTLDLPGVWQTTDPNFDINDPDTWVGDAAPYVNHNYFYTVRYQVENTGQSDALDVEVDLYYIYDNGDEELETLNLGDMGAFDSRSSVISISSVNRELVDVQGEVYWYDEW